MNSSSDRPRIVVLGGACIDVVLRLAGLPEWQCDRPADLELVVPGGKALNQAVACSRLGARVALVAPIGDDHPARQLLGTLQDAGVDQRFLARRPGTTTPMTFVLLDRHGRKAFLSTGLAAAERLTIKDAERAASWLRPHDVGLATLESAPDVVGVFLNMARRAGARTILNPAPTPVDAVAVQERLLETAEFLVPNVREARALLGDGAPRDPAELSIRLCARWPVTACVTAGSDGSFLCADGKVEHIAAPRVKVVDPTGASDAFCAAFAVALARGIKTSAAVRVANAAGGAAVEELGAAPSMPDLEAVAKRCDVAARRALYEPQFALFGSDADRSAVTPKW